MFEIRCDICNEVVTQGTGKEFLQQLSAQYSKESQDPNNLLEKWYHVVCGRCVACYGRFKVEDLVKEAVINERVKAGELKRPADAEQRG